jgi:uncharacterized protein (DUF3084 family)
MACSGSSTAEARKALQAVTSWAATAHLVGDAWLAHAAPRTYTAQTLLHARQQLQKLQKQLQTLQSRLPPASAAERERLFTHIQNLTQTVSQMRSAVNQDDAARLRQQLTQLGTEQDALVSVLAQSDVQP